ncbi:MAG: universal stress protein [Parafilimonas sp.]
MQTILVPVDFTEAEIHTAQYAIHFAKQVGAAKIILFHAIDNYIESDSELKTIDLGWEFYDHVVKERQEDLDNFRDKLLQYDSSVTLETQCVALRLLDMINDVCKDLNIDIIITGRVYKGELTESLFGSNIIALANRSETPMIIVPSEAGFNSINEILFAYDFNTQTETISSACIKDIFDKTKAKIFVLHTEAQQTNKPQPSQLANKEFSALIDLYNPEYHNLPSEDFRLAINDFVSDKKIDLIITIPKKQGLFEGLFKKNYTKELAFHTHVPLMVLH